MIISFHATIYLCMKLFVGVTWLTYLLPDLVVELVERCWLDLLQVDLVEEIFLWFRVLVDGGQGPPPAVVWGVVGRGRLGGLAITQQDTLGGGV